MTEPRTVRWKRRAKTIPTMLAVTVVGVMTLPLLVPVIIVADILRGRLRMPLVRTYLFALQYMINDSVEIVLAPIYWLMAGFGTRLETRASIERHRRLQQWSVQLLERRADQLLGLRLDLSDDDLAALIPGPVIVISRHMSLFDASLPGLLYQRHEFDVRGIIMAELLADPGFDLLYGRLGSVFIPRNDGRQARAAIDSMSAGSDDRSAFVLFPEGRLFRPSVRDRALTRLAETDPERGIRLAGLQHVLPPRPGGFLSLLDTNPSADVVLIDHRGLDKFRRMSNVAKVAPVNGSIAITVERFPRSDLPTEATDQVLWLDELWLKLDASLDGERAI